MKWRSILYKNMYRARNRLNAMHLRRIWAVMLLFYPAVALARRLLNSEQKRRGSTTLWPYTVGPKLLCTVDFGIEWL